MSTSKAKYDKEMFKNQARNRELQKQKKLTVNNSRKITRDLDSYVAEKPPKPVVSKKKSNDNEVLGGPNLLINKQKKFKNINKYNKN